MVLSVPETGPLTVMASAMVSPLELLLRVTVPVASSQSVSSQPFAERSSTDN